MTTFIQIILDWLMPLFTCFDADTVDTDEDSSYEAGTPCNWKAQMDIAIRDVQTAGEVRFCRIDVPDVPDVPDVLDVLDVPDVPDVLHNDFDDFIIV